MDTSTYPAPQTRARSTLQRIETAVESRHRVCRSQGLLHGLTPLPIANSRKVRWHDPWQGGVGWFVGWETLPRNDRAGCRKPLGMLASGWDGCTPIQLFVAAHGANTLALEGGDERLPATQPRNASRAPASRISAHRQSFSASSMAIMARGLRTLRSSSGGLSRAKRDQIRS